MSDSRPGYADARADRDDRPRSLQTVHDGHLDVKQGIAGTCMRTSATAEEYETVTSIFADFIQL